MSFAVCILCIVTSRVYRFEDLLASHSPRDNPRCDMDFKLEALQQGSLGLNRADNAAEEMVFRSLTLIILLDESSIISIAYTPKS